MPPLSVLIKPASGNCNLRCRYCFYNSISGQRSIKDYGIMSIETLEVIVKKAFDYAEASCSFAFQGGEPTLAGLDFYKQLMKFQKKYNVKNIKVNNSIQTNGIIIDEAWAEFLAHNNFLAGISLDGDSELHNLNRVDYNNKGSHNRVMNTIKLFNKYKVEYNILFVVSAAVARYAGKTYSYFKNGNFKYIQFIPCIDPFDQGTVKQSFSLTPQRYGEFLKTFFDLWYRDMMIGKGISIRTFDNFISMIMGYPPEACDMSGTCTCQFVIEADGGVYPCDFYVLDEWHLGNILTDSFHQLRTCPTAIKFIEDSQYISQSCRECKWLKLCRGGCRRMREPFLDNKPALNYHCQAYKDFFRHTIGKMQEIAVLYKQ